MPSIILYLSCLMRFGPVSQSESEFKLYSTEARQMFNYVVNKDSDAIYGATTGAAKELALNVVGFLQDTSPKTPPKDVAGWYPVRLLCDDPDTFIGALQYTGTRFC